MTRYDAIEFANYCLKANVNEEFAKQEWKAAISDNTSFRVYAANDLYVIIDTYVEDDEVMYSVLFG